MNRRGADVVIVGAGASGWLLASLLAERSLRVAVLGQHFQRLRDDEFLGLVRQSDLTTLAPGGPPAHLLMPIPRAERFALGDRTAAPVDAVGTSIVRHDDLLAWLRTRATGSGVVFEPRATVTDLVWRDGTVHGVICGAERMVWNCSLVVLADGSDPRLAEGPGLRPDWPPPQLMHIGKQRFRRPDGVVSDPTAAVFAGRTSWGDPAHGMLLLGDEDGTLVVAVLLETEMESTRHIREALDEVREHPLVSHRLARWEPRAFVTEVIPIGGVVEPPRLSGDGMLMVGDTAGLTHPLNRDGLSANGELVRAAAETIAEAARSGDWTSIALAQFDERVREDVVEPLRRRAAARQIANVDAWIVSTESGPLASIPRVEPLSMDSGTEGVSGARMRPTALAGRLWGGALARNRSPRGR